MVQAWPRSQGDRASLITKSKPSKTRRMSRIDCSALADGKSSHSGQANLPPPLQQVYIPIMAFLTADREAEPHREIKQGRLMEFIDKEAEKKNKIVDDIDPEEIVIDDEEETPEPPIDEDGDTEPNEDPADNDDDDEGEFTVNLETATPADDDDDIEIPDDAPTWAKKLRKQNRETVKRAKEAERKLKEREAELEAKTETKIPELGAKPTLEDHDYDDEAFEAALLNWHDTKRHHDAKKAAAKEAAEAAQKDYNNRFQSYTQAKVKLGVPDYDKAESVVKETLTVEQQGIIIDAAADPAILVLALSQNPKQLKSLAAEKNYTRFAAKMAVMETKLKKPNKQKPSPERRVKGGSAERGAVGDKQLEQLRAKAAKTGDYSEVSAYKRRMKSAAS